MEFAHTHPDTGRRVAHLATIGYYEDGAVGEVFVNTRRQSNDAANLARDAALILSIALQYGVPVEELAASVSRVEKNGGLPHTIIGSVLDLLVREQQVAKQ